MAETLELRAARYFGMHAEPRTSVQLGEGRVLILGERAGRKVFALYDERFVGHGGSVYGTYKLLSDRQRAAMLAALHGGRDR